MWEATLLGVTVATLIGGAFVGGCFCGSWVQRSIGYVIRTRVENEILEQAKDREEKAYERRRAEDYQNRRVTDAEEALLNLGQPGDNPLGPIVPSPEDLDRIMDGGHDFASTLSTERLKKAREANRG